MNNLILLTYHHSYGGNGMTDWIAHMAISSVVHALIYGLVFKIMHQLTLVQAVVLVAVVLGVLIMWGQSRDRRG